MTTRSNDPLAGITVVSLAVNLPGPVAAARLASMGATVVKVEPPTGDPLRSVVPSWYDELASGQEVISLDLKDAADRAQFESRLASADVLLTSMRPSASARLRLAESALRHGLVLVEIVGYVGDRAEESGHDLTYQAVHGTVLPPTMPLVPLVDLLGAERAVSAVLAGLRQRDHSEPGKSGQQSDPAPHLKVVLDDVAQHAASAVRHGLTGPNDVLGGASPVYGLYATTDGHVAVGAVEPHFAARLGHVVGTTRDELTARFATDTSDHWEALGRKHDIPIVAVRDPRTLRASSPAAPSKPQPAASPTHS
ncbi:hypothetical protein BA895_11580 [Humibacillus sp. DSM 29435]|uniref:CoA transferase n=1 Tax=Humibacillus sp. DSM 29435 TaxID=1869167 RepID=UPI0008733650|nr:CoA transferase [Humibacillus sp. DSM 29435]OFE14244.1 hypothetical protein BA895_11580 [Humibacillus sp. DSM 29435]